MLECFKLNVTCLREFFSSEKGWVMYDGPPACVTLSNAALNNEQTWVSPASRVGPLNGRKRSHQYLLCEQGSRRVDRPGAWVAQRHIEVSTHIHKHSGVLLQPPSLKPPFPTQCNYNTGRQAGTSDCCFWPHSFLCQRTRALTTARLLIDATIKLLSVRFNHIAVKLSGKWPYYLHSAKVNLWFLIMAAPNKETTLIVLSSFDYINCY